MPVTTVLPTPLERIGEAIADRLKIVFPEAKFQHAWLPAKLTPKSWNALLRRTPFVGIGWGTLDPKRDAAFRDFSGHSTWSVFLVVRNEAGVRQRYYGDMQGPGLLPMVAAAVAILHGHTIRDVGSMQVERAGNAYADGWDADDTALAAIDVSVGTSLPLHRTIEGVEVDALAQLGITWQFGADTFSDTETS